MAKRKKIEIETEKEKKPISDATENDFDGIDVNTNTNINVNSIKKTSINQEVSSVDDATKGRHFWFVVYPSETYFKTNFPDGTYDGSEGWGNAPDDWVEQLKNTGLAFQQSELHYHDVNPDGKEKKPHWHVIVSWGNTTTYRQAKGLANLLKSPLPKLLHNVMGAYRYHRHLDNPEKYQYKTYGVCHNGWTAPLDSNAVVRIKREIKDIVLMEDVQEYAELLIVCENKGQEYFDVVVNNTVYCERLCASYRHNPVRVLSRYYHMLDDGDAKKDEILERIRSYDRKDE